METISIKQRFLEDNTDYKEIKPNEESTTSGDFQGIDEIEDEVWLLQCPKGFDVEAELQSQKLKIPGRTTINTAESIAVEYVNPEIRSFGYCNRKGRYSLRLLAVKGSILLRGRLKATEAVTLENVEALCPPQGRVPLPEMVKVRHPLHGHQFDKSLRVDRAIAKRLKKADEVSAKMHYEAVINRRIIKNHNVNRSKHKQRSNLPFADAHSILIESDGEKEEFLGEVKQKYPKSSKSNALNRKNEGHILDKIPKKKKKISKSDIVEEVAKDLQWLQNI